MLRLVGLLAAVVVTTAGIGQRQPAPLDTPIPGLFPIADPMLLSRCSAGVAIDQAARLLHVPAGFESAPDCAASGPAPVRGTPHYWLSGITGRQLIDRLVATIPEFSWRDLGGIVVARPAPAWANADDLLNQPVQAFRVARSSVQVTVDTALRAATPSLYVRQDASVGPGPFSQQRLTMAFPGGTLLDALNLLVRALGGAQWQVGYLPDRAEIVVTTPDFPGDWVRVPVRLSDRW